MIRRLFTCGAALSLLLCAAVVALWVRSYWRVDTVGLPQSTWEANGRWNLTQRWVESEGAGVRVMWVRGSGSTALGGRPLPLGAYGRPGWQVRPTSPRALRDPPPLWVGAWSQPVLFAYSGPSPPAGYTMSGVVVPYWMPFAATVLLPAWWARGRARDRWRRQQGLCPACGYDLRTSASACPECGAAIPSHEQRPALDSPADVDAPPAYLVNELVLLLILLPVIPAVLVERGYGWAIPRERLPETWQTAAAVAFALGWGAFAWWPGRWFIRRVMDWRRRPAAGDARPTGRRAIS